MLDIAELTEVVNVSELNWRDHWQQQLVEAAETRRVLRRDPKRPGRERVQAKQRLTAASDL